MQSQQITFGNSDVGIFPDQRFLNFMQLSQTTYNLIFDPTERYFKLNY